MASRFKGRDYISLREEIINFLKQRLPSDWDETNLADPIVIFSESLAKMGDQLHFTLDELRRECDIATAQRASSIYSYAMREGYKMMLPRGSFGTLTVTTTKDLSNKLTIKLDKFTELTVKPTNDTLVVKSDINSTISEKIDSSIESELFNKDYSDKNKLKEVGKYAEYANSLMARTVKIPVVLGTKQVFNFSLSDINTDSTVDIPEFIIDRDTVRLTHSNGRELVYVDDVIASGFNKNSFTLTPKFIGGATRLCIEFPSNYRDLFKGSDGKFEFTYVSIYNNKIDPTLNSDIDYIVDLSQFVSADNPDGAIEYNVDFGGGIKGYVEFESPEATRENYKRFVQNYSALLTKDDFASYVKANTSQNCLVFDHSDNWKENTLPADTSLIERCIYIVTDAKYNGRKLLWEDLTERSSRSDCVIVVPFGIDPYTIVIKAECYLVGTSVSSIVTSIKSEILSYYSDSFSNKFPDVSMINYLVHKASDKVIRMDSCIVRDSTYGTTDKTFNDVSSLNNDQVDNLFSALNTDDASIPSYSDDPHSPYHYLVDETGTYRKYLKHTYNSVPDSFPKIYHGSEPGPISRYEDLVKYQITYGSIDSSAWDSEPIFKDGSCDINEDYSKHHYMSPILNNVVVLVKTVTK